MSKDDDSALDSLHDLLTDKQTVGGVPMDKNTDGQQLNRKSLPPVHIWHPEVTRDIDMRIARNGDWYYQGSLIQRQRMVDLFSTVLRCDDDGHTYLVTPQERLRIQVEDAPFTAVLLQIEGEGKSQSLFFTTNTGDRVLAGEQYPITIEYTRPDGEPSPYVLVRGNLRALMSRAVFMQMAQVAAPVQNNTDEQEQLRVISDGYSMLLPVQ